MPYTDQSDVYSAVHEDGVNTLIDHLQRKRPSLFNYATERLIETKAQAEFHLERRASYGSGGMCAAIEAAPEVSDWDNPHVEEVDPLPVIGTEDMIGLDYCYQVADMEIDFAPADLEVDVGDQQFAASVVVCGGIACPVDSEYEAVRQEYLGLLEDHDPPLSEAEKTELGLPLVPEAESLECFCLQVTVVGSVGTNATDASGGAGEPEAPGKWLRIAQTPELRIDDIVLGSEEDEFRMPDGLPGSITCYIRSFIEFTLVPQLNRTLGFVPSLPADSLLSIEFGQTRATASLPEGSGIPNNPALEDDQLELFVDLELRKRGGS